MTPFAPNGKGQQSFLSGEHPICGNSVTGFGAPVTIAKYGWLQLPVIKGLPSKDAVRVAPVNVAGWETTLPETVENSTVDVAKVLACVEPLRKTLLARFDGAQPTKFGAVSLTLLHSC